ILAGVDDVGHEIHVAAGRKAGELLEIPFAAGELFQQRFDIWHEGVMEELLPLGIMLREVTRRERRGCASIRLRGVTKALRQERPVLLYLLDGHAGLDEPS